MAVRVDACSYKLLNVAGASGGGRHGCMFVFSTMSVVPFVSPACPPHNFSPARCLSM